MVMVPAYRIEHDSIAPTNYKRSNNSIENIVMANN
jgi:hypothetical protein